MRAKRWKIIQDVTTRFEGADLREVPIQKKRVRTFCCLMIAAPVTDVMIRDDLKGHLRKHVWPVLIPLCMTSTFPAHWLRRARRHTRATEDCLSVAFDAISRDECIGGEGRSINDLGKEHMREELQEKWQEA